MDTDDKEEIRLRELILAQVDLDSSNCATMLIEIVNHMGLQALKDFVDYSGIQDAG